LNLLQKTTYEVKKKKGGYFNPEPRSVPPERLVKNDGARSGCLEFIPVIRR